VTAGATWLSLADDGDEFCQDESFTARCDRLHDVVLMESARYGRLRLGRCVRRNLGYLGCMVDALRLLDSRCSGQPHGCSVSIMDPQLRQLRPCPLDVTWHLDARYRCVQGQCLPVYVVTSWPLRHAALPYNYRLTDYHKTEHLYSTISVE